MRIVLAILKLQPGHDAGKHARLTRAELALIDVQPLDGANEEFFRYGEITSTAGVAPFACLASQGAMPASYLLARLRLEPTVMQRDGLARDSIETPFNRFSRMQ